VESAESLINCLPLPNLKFASTERFSLKKIKKSSSCAWNLPINNLNTHACELQGDKMHQVLKTFFLAACLLVAAFFANYFGYISIPWLDINTVPTYGGEAQTRDKVVNQLLEVEKADTMSE
jgi:hypothetical protein